MHVRQASGQVSRLDRFRKGLEADPKRIAVIQAIKSPTSKSEVRSLLGLINYYGKFAAHLHDYKAPFEDFLAEERKFEWSR